MFASVIKEAVSSFSLYRFDLVGKGINHSVQFGFLDVSPIVSVCRHGFVSESLVGQDHFLCSEVGGMEASICVPWLFGPAGWAPYSYRDAVRAPCLGMPTGWAARSCGPESGLHDYTRPQAMLHIRKSYRFCLAFLQSLRVGSPTV